MNRLVQIAIREYLENVKTKAFILAVAMTPLMLGLSFLIPVLLEGRPPEQRKVAFLDVEGTLAEGVAKRLESRLIPGPEKTSMYLVERIPLDGADPAGREKGLEPLRKDLDRRVLVGDLFAYVVIRPSALDRRKDAKRSEYRSGNLIDIKVFEDIRRDLREEVNRRVIEEGGVPKVAAEILTSEIPIDLADVRATGKAGNVAATVMPFAFMLLLFLTIVTMSQALITSTLEEKGNRVIEVLLSSVSPFQLMAGKVAGTCAVGLTLMTIWAGAGLLGLAVNGIQMVEAGLLALCLAYYLLGFLLIASLMVAIGSACNSLKEAQNLLAPVMFVLTVPMFFLIVVGKDPNGSLSRIVSMIPLFTPFLMMVRISASPPPPPYEIAASLVILAASAFLALRLAARVFRVGVLMYGKPPSVREIFRWMRVKD